MGKNFVFIFLFFYLALGDRLILVQETFRHGARYPIHYRTEDYSAIAESTHNVGELTGEGKNMHYLLGRLIYEKYWNQLFNRTHYENTEIYVKSTDVNRTLESAQSHLFGLLESIPPLELSESELKFSMPQWEDEEYQSENISEIKEIFRNASAFHPIPIHSEKVLASPDCDDGDFLTKFEESSCPNQKFWTAENKNDDESNEVMRTPIIVEAIEALSNTSGVSVSFWDVYKWVDSFVALKYLGFQRLNIFEDPKYKSVFGIFVSYLDFISVYTMYKELFNQKKQIKTVATPYLLRTLENFEKAITNSKSDVYNISEKLIIYSAHDTTIAMVLTILGLSSPQCIKDHYFNVFNKEKQNVNSNENSDANSKENSNFNRRLQKSPENSEKILKSESNEESFCIYEYPKYSSNIIFELWERDGGYYVKMLYNGEPMILPMCSSEECSFDVLKTWIHENTVKDVKTECGVVKGNRNFYAFIFLFSVAIGILGVYACCLNFTINKIDTIGRAKKQGYIENFEEKVHEEIQK